MFTIQMLRNNIKGKKKKKKRSDQDTLQEIIIASGRTLRYKVTQTTDELCNFTDVNKIFPFYFSFWSWKTGYHFLFFF